jgi:hypothetical protein
MAKLTESQMDVLIQSFSKIMNNNDMKTKFEIIKCLNKNMIDLFDEPITKNYMFGFKKHDCFITFNHVIKKNPDLIVSFNKRLKCLNLKELNKDPEYYPEFSHQITFSQFCFENCNPNILHILERVLFEVA